MTEIKLIFAIIYLPTLSALLIATWKVCALRNEVEREKKRAEQLEFQLRQALLD